MGQVVQAARDPVMIDQIQATWKVLLDVGCGEGYFARVDRDVGNVRLVGADISPDPIGRTRLQDYDGKYDVHVTGTNPPWSPGNFDAVSARTVLIDLPDLDFTYSAIFTSLTPTGRLVACIVNAYHAFPVDEWR